MTSTRRCTELGYVNCLRKEKSKSYFCWSVTDMLFESLLCIICVTYYEFILICRLLCCLWQNFDLAAVYVSDAQYNRNIFFDTSPQAVRYAMDKLTNFLWVCDGQGSCHLFWWHCISFFGQAISTLQPLGHASPYLSVHICGPWVSSVWRARTDP